MLSIVIPTRDRSAMLQRSLESVAGGIAAVPCLEIIVVDNGSSDDTRAIYEGVRARHAHLHWRYLTEPVAGLVASRHRGTTEARGEVLCFLDDDVSVPSDWGEHILAPFADPNVHFVGCRYLPDFEHEPPTWLEALWWERDGIRSLGHLSLLDAGESGHSYAPMLVWGLCFAVRRQTVIKLGGFHPDAYPWELRRFRGDGENGLAAKAEMLGLGAYYQGRTHVLHRVPASRMTPEYFEKRSYLQGISDSYTRIRREGAVPPRPARSWKDAVRPFKWRLKRRNILRTPTADGVRYLMARAHMEGRAFHEEEVRNDPALLEWVLRRDYFDYRLPARSKDGVPQRRPTE